MPVTHVDADGETRRIRTRTHHRSHGQRIVVAPVTLQLSTTTAAPQTAVTATIGNGPGFVGDWVGLYAVGSSNLIDWVYMSGTKTAPAIGLKNAVVTLTMPAASGSYVLRFSSGQIVLVSSPTIVVAP